jgi:hypothetical protein
MFVTSLFKADKKTKFYKTFLPDKDFSGNMNIEERKVYLKKTF